MLGASVVGPNAAKRLRRKLDRGMDVDAALTELRFQYSDIYVISLSHGKLRVELDVHWPVPESGRVWEGPF